LVFLAAHQLERGSAFHLLAGLANLRGVVVRVQRFSVQMFRQFPYTSPASFSSSFFGVYQPSAAGGLAQWNPTLLVALPISPGRHRWYITLHFSLHAQWNPTSLVALPIPPGKPKEKRSKRNSLSVEALAKAEHPVVLALFEISS
jgi:hypothetical protein